MRDKRVIRGHIIQTVILLLFVVLAVNLFVMQIPRHGYYKGQALDNRQDRFRVRAPRGRIMDRDGCILADNQFISDITVPASAIIDTVPGPELLRLIDWFELPVEDTTRRLLAQKRRGRRRLVLVANASMPRIMAVEERHRELPGVRVESRARRRYLHGPLFAHVVGYVGEVDQDDIAASSGDSLGYRMGDTKGKLGLEATCEPWLRGRDGIKLEEVDATGRIVGRQTMWLAEVQHGGDLYLTLSAALQDSLARLLGGRPGCAVALSLPEGEVLAACSSPSYDANMLTTTISPAAWNDLVNDPAKPFFNRIIQATYPPGSLYKVVSSLCAFENGAATYTTVLDSCKGGFLFGDRVFHCWKRSGHGALAHDEALIHSCDIFYYQIGLRLDIDQLAETAKVFGLGQRCVSLFPEEASGLVPTRAWYDRRFGKNGWTRGVMLNNIIGQGELLVTPLQMAVLAARIATSGRTGRPRFIQSPQQLPGGVEELDPLPRLPFSERRLAWVRSTMAQVVGEGTGQAARLAGIEVAGKTGTSQNPHGEDHAWFMCFAPVEEPQVALAVILENAGHGGVEAAPLAGRWLRSYFQWRGVHVPELPADGDGTGGGRSR